MEVAVTTTSETNNNKKQTNNKKKHTHPILKKTFELKLLSFIETHERNHDHFKHTQGKSTMQT